MQNKKEYKLVLCQDAVDPDPELLAWEKWINIRKEEIDALAHRTRRNTGELVMNLCEKIREKKEEKIVLDNAQVEKKARVRGALWDQPERLKQTCYCEPVYEIQRTRVEKGRPGIIQHIGVPKHIQETEMGISGSHRKTFMKLNSEYESYKKTRKSELAESIKKIDPYRSNLEDLIVIGKKPKSCPKKFPTLPDIITSDDNKALQDDLCSVYAIKINDSIFYKEVPNQTLSHLSKMQSDLGQAHCNSWSYYFNSPVNRVARSKLYLQNLGTVSLRYCWRKINSANSDETQLQVFFFNKNENVICPGQSQEVCFTFMTNEPGSYEDSWELVFLNVSFFDSLENRFNINLCADSVENIAKMKRKTQKLEKFIYATVLANMARDFIGEIILRATSIEPQVYPYQKLFLEADIFVMKNPVCYYHQTEVMKMKDMYAEILPGETWDLAIGSWRRAIINQGFDDRMKNYKSLISLHRELLRPWYEENDLYAQKLKAVGEVLRKFVDEFDKEYVQIFKMFYGFNQGPREGNISLENVMIYPSSSIIRHIFYLRIHEHFGTAVELCAGLLSSLDLNRWIHFDFCKT